MGWFDSSCPSANPRNHLKVLSKVIFTRSVAVSLGLGQSLSLLICGTAVTSGLLQKESVNIPTGQSFLTYLLLSVTFTSWLCYSDGVKTIPKILKDRGWKYFLLAVIDVEANYLVIKAYQYTSVTSVQLLDCITIPTVLILSWRLLSVKYKWSHLVGVAACLLGAGSLVLADHLAGQHNENSSNMLLGDILVVCGAVLYGISNIGQECMISGFGTIEYLGSYSFLASFISGIQFAILERQEVSSVDFLSLSVALPLLGFVVCLFFFASLMSYAMLKIGAMAVNLNLLSSDFFALLVGLFIFQYKFHFLYFIAFFLITVGLLIYNVLPTKSSKSAHSNAVDIEFSENHTDIPGLGHSMSYQNTLSKSDVPFKMSEVGRASNEDNIDSIVTQDTYDQDQDQERSALNNGIKDIVGQIFCNDGLTVVTQL